MWLALFTLAALALLVGFERAASYVLIAAAWVFALGGAAVIAGAAFVVLALFKS